MSTDVTIYPDRPATVDHALIRLDDTTAISLPPDQRGAEWCRHLSRLLADEADRLDEAHEQAVRDLAAARRYVEQVKREKGLR